MKKLHMREHSKNAVFLCIFHLSFNCAFHSPTKLHKNGPKTYLADSAQSQHLELMVLALVPWGVLELAGVGDSRVLAKYEALQMF